MSRPPTRTSLGVAAALCAALLALSACSGGDGDDAEHDRLVELIAGNMRTTEQGIDSAEAHCIAEAMVDEVGVERLADVQGPGDFGGLDKGLQDALVAAAADAIAACGVEVGPGG